MFSPLKTFKSTGIFLSCFFFLSLTGHAQESTTYYRYFEVNLDRTVDSENDLRSDLFDDNPFQLHSSCELKNSILVAVPANYPKRIPEIRKDIEALLGKEISAKKISSLNLIKAIDREAYCE